MTDSAAPSESSRAESPHQRVADIEWQRASETRHLPLGAALTSRAEPAPPLGQGWVSQVTGPNAPDMNDAPPRSEGSEAPRILPCPFCGHWPRFSVRRDESLWSHDIVWWSSIVCSVCDVQRSECDDADGAKVVAAWNHRAPSDEGNSAPPGEPNG